MSNISIQDIIARSPGANNFDSSFAFKLTKEDKDEFISICEKLNLSPSNILRELLSGFIAQACPDED